ncbi:aldolase/citrate lyase family protein [Helicobacter canis]|uniref:aldolase/citrate lyase family protein n=1 Tax=Helicobacter canis TaxID=29419 RepID=UPI002943E014|nr:aldolase/citrate lyase family protein [Helicobacter canis]
MNRLELQMVDVLKDLCQNYGVVGVKAEFEAEGTRLEEAMRLKEVVSKAGLDLTMKIGGCEAIKDMREAKLLGVSHIVAPMIETAYALEKYANAASVVFADENVSYFINIETITGFNNLQAICASKAFEKISGIVLGRVDMTGSLGLSRDEIHSEKILQIATCLANTCLNFKKDMVIGGGVSIASLPFFATLPPHSLTRFETRKVIFNASAAMSNPHIADGLMKAVHFELLWLRNKREFYQSIYEEDSARIAMLEERYGKFLQKGDGSLR